MKIGALLVLGFGEAGAAIIASNIAKVGDVGFNTQGLRIQAIFGFCDIRQFTDTTEVLQEGVMVFVNEIANIVHNIVDQYQGAANKNIGDAFLLVWKFEEDYGYDRQSFLADLALFSFLKIIAKINRSPTILKYRFNKALLQELPGYSVKMGFGLHKGWAIEGAIGSQHKIDASYLSPNVNLASRLEAATKQYGVPLLISGDMFQQLNLPVQMYCRHIDTVNVKGSKLDLKLYTVDVDVDVLPPSGTKQVSKATSKQIRKGIKYSLDINQFDSFLLFKESTDVQRMRDGFTVEFYDVFDQGMQHYIDGNWKKALELFRNALNYQPEDGPSSNLIKYIEENSCNPPNNWAGCRILEEK